MPSLQHAILFASFLALINAACNPIPVADPRPVGTVLPPGCDREYLKDYLRQLFTHNFDGAQKSPTQWAAMGINRRVSASDTYRGTTTDMVLPAGVWRPRSFAERLSVPSSKNPNKLVFGYNSILYGAFPSGKTFWLRSFLRKHSDDDYLPSDHGNIGNPGADWVAASWEGANIPHFRKTNSKDDHVHTERLIRNQIFKESPFPFLEPVESFYIYTYSTPCFAGCRNDVFGLPTNEGQPDNTMMKAVKENLVEGAVVQFYLGFDVMYNGNDDLQAWLGYQSYMAWPANTMGFTAADATDRWTLIPLQGSFQELVVKLLMETEFCAQCRVVPNFFAAYTPDFTYSGYPGDQATLSRAKAIYYLVENTLYLLGNEKIAALQKLLPEMEHPEMDLDRDITSNNQRLRSHSDWSTLIRKLSSDKQYQDYIFRLFNRIFQWQVGSAAESKLTSRFFVDLGNRGKLAETDPGYERKIPFAPPIQKENFYTTSANFNAAPDAGWPIRCEGTDASVYSGKLCETGTLINPRGRGRGRGAPMNQATGIRGKGRGGGGRFRDEDGEELTIPPNWQEYSGKNNTKVPGIFLAYGVGNLAQDEVLYIGGGLDVAMEMTKFKRERIANDDVFKTAARGMIFTEIPNAGIAEINGYLYLLKTVFCTMADNPQNGGAVTANLCHKDPGGVVIGDPISVPDYFNSNLLGRFQNKTINGILVPSIPQRLLNAPGPVQSSPYTGTQCLLYTIDPTATPEPTFEPSSDSSLSPEA